MTEPNPKPRRASRTAPAQDAPLGTVTITAKEVYSAVMTLTGKVDTVLARDDHQANTIRDHETRIRGLEQLRWPLPSLAVLLSLAGLLIAIFRP